MHWTILNSAIIGNTVVICEQDSFLYTTRHRLLWRGGNDLEYEN